MYANAEIEGEKYSRKNDTKRLSASWNSVIHQVIKENHY